jgi:hypothetical protein
MGKHEAARIFFCDDLFSLRMKSAGFFISRGETKSFFYELWDWWLKARIV